MTSFIQDKGVKNKMSILTKIKNIFSKGETMKAKRATYKKQDNSLRTMTYLELETLEKLNMLPKTIGTRGMTKNLKPGYKTVWDFDKNGVRTINENTIINGVQEVDIDVTEFKKNYL